MSLEMVEKIREVEAEADAIIKQAGIRAREIVAEANKQAYESELGVDTQAQKEIAKKIDAAAREAETEKEHIQKEAEKEAEALEFLVRPKLSKAADFIIERIVG